MENEPNDYKNYLRIAEDQDKYWRSISQGWLRSSRVFFAPINCPVSNLVWRAYVCPCLARVYERNGKPEDLQPGTVQNRPHNSDTAKQGPPADQISWNNEPSRMIMSVVVGGGGRLYLACLQFHEDNHGNRALLPASLILGYAPQDH